MSYTTDVVLKVGGLDEKRVGEFNATLSTAGFEASADTPSLTCLSTNLANLPGSKYFSGSLWAACWNYGLKDPLTAAFQQFDWEEPEKAVLIWTPEQSDAEVFRLDVFGKLLDALPPVE